MRLKSSNKATVIRRGGGEGERKKVNRKYAKKDDMARSTTTDGA
jgi:hypothetical protein